MRSRKRRIARSAVVSGLTLAVPALLATSGASAGDGDAMIVAQMFRPPQAQGQPPAAQGQPQEENKGENRRGNRGNGGGRGGDGGGRGEGRGGGEGREGRGGGRSAPPPIAQPPQPPQMPRAVEPRQMPRPIPQQPAVQPTPPPAAVTPRAAEQRGKFWNKPQHQQPVETPRNAGEGRGRDGEGRGGPNRFPSATSDPKPDPRFGGGGRGRDGEGRGRDGEGRGGPNRFPSATSDPKPDPRFGGEGRGRDGEGRGRDGEGRGGPNRFPSATSDPKPDPRRGGPVEIRPDNGSRGGDRDGRNFGEGRGRDGDRDGRNFGEGRGRDGDRDGRRFRDRNDTAQGERFRNIEALRQGRQERRGSSGRSFLEEADRRTIVRGGDRPFIIRDESQRFRRFDRDASTRRRPDGRTLTSVRRPGGVEIFNETGPDGRLVRRYRRGPDGREFNLIDNRRTWRRWNKDRGIGFAINIAPPVYRMARDRYIIDYDRASYDDIYDALDAPPFDEIDGRYTLDEVLSTYNLRERMRRIDLDSINFEFGSWQVEESQYDKLERVARAMNRIIERKPDEVFLIEGHTDAVGDDIDNLSLSDRRAEEVANILTQEFDVPPENLVTQGYGEQFLKIDTNEAERANRRVTLRRITPLLARN